MGPEDNPADEVQPTKEEWEEYERTLELKLDEIFNVPFTFSINCRSGCLERCECWRCRKERGEPVTEESEELARLQADEVDCEQARKTVPE